MDRKTSLTVVAAFSAIAVFSAIALSACDSKDAGTGTVFNVSGDYREDWMCTESGTGRCQTMPFPGFTIMTLTQNGDQVTREDKNGAFRTWTGTIVGMVVTVTTTGPPETSTMTFNADRTFSVVSQYVTGVPPQDCTGDCTGTGVPQ